MVFQLVVLGALSAAFIPVFSEYFNKSEEEAYKLASSLITLLMTIFIFFSIIIFIFALPFSKIITGNFSGEQITLMVRMTRLMLLAQAFFLISNFFSAMIQSQKRFLIPALAPILYNLGIIFSVWFLGGSLGVWAAAIGVVIGAFLHLLIQLPLIKKLGFFFRPKIDIKDKGVRKILKLMFPRTMSLAAGQIEATFSLFLATSLSAGSLTIYYLAQRLSDLPVRLLGTSVGQAALPILSFQLAEGKTEQFKKTVGESLNQIFYLAFPITSFFLILRVQLVRFAYGSRSFPWLATIVTGKTLAVIAFSIFSQSSIQLLVRCFYAVHDTFTPFVISLFSVALNIILSVVFVLVLKLEIFGLALGFSNFINFLLLMGYFQKKWAKFIDKKTIFVWLKMALSSLFAGAGCWLVMKILDNYVFLTTKTFPLLIVTTLALFFGIGIYILFSKIFKIEELSVLFKIGKKIGNWKNTLFSVKEVIEPHTGQGTAV
jgi:putative peptidoglycan lipid II flippase